MKISKIVMGVGALTLAAVGAFASNANFRLNTYWYHPTTTTCASTLISFTCNTTATAACIGPVDAPSENKQLFLTSGCLTALKRP
ncbi:hypothetical protein GO495_06730 [Chitinophaga oryziterrae]|uniref:Secreted protein n=1 Tax=Chitinophaga oryziterrae TaxID=1031224 RepID=A0A6N8J517_9BACT|nr:DUF6520 family protein [Chitinophaga oryziterrae]MVT40270.1 hypothetical protein [Chitinophaga oryziterrae]